MGWRHSKPFYRSGKYPKYYQGQIIYLWRSEKIADEPGHIRHWCEPYEIISVSKTKSGGIFFKEFVYKVKDNLGNEKKNIYESEILTSPKDDYIEETDFI